MGRAQKHSLGTAARGDGCGMASLNSLAAYVRRLDARIFTLEGRSSPSGDERRCQLFVGAPDDLLYVAGRVGAVVAWRQQREQQLEQQAVPVKGATGELAEVQTKHALQEQRQQLQQQRRATEFYIGSGSSSVRSCSVDGDSSGVADCWDVEPAPELSPSAAERVVERAAVDDEHVSDMIATRTVLAPLPERMECLEQLLRDSEVKTRCLERTLGDLADKYTSLERVDELEKLLSDSAAVHSAGLQELKRAQDKLDTEVEALRDTIGRHDNDLQAMQRARDQVARDEETAKQISELTEEVGRVQDELQQSCEFLVDLIETKVADLGRLQRAQVVGASEVGGDAVARDRRRQALADRLRA